MNTLFDEEIRGHHSMRDHLLALVSDADLGHPMPGHNPPLGDLLIDMGHLQGVYTHSFDALTLDWTHQLLPSPEPVTVTNLRSWFDAQDNAMKSALDRFSPEELNEPRIDRGDGFVASPFVQHQVYREAVYIYYGKLSIYLRALEREGGPDWDAWIG